MNMMASGRKKKGKERGRIRKEVMGPRVRCGMETDDRTGYHVICWAAINGPYDGDDKRRSSGKGPESWRDDEGRLLSQLLYSVIETEGRYLSLPCNGYSNQLEIYF